MVKLLWVFAPIAMAIAASAYACSDKPALAPVALLDAEPDAWSRADAKMDSGPADSGEPDPYAAYDCPHVPVVQKCTNGWCEIPAGCFWMGSPESEPGRGQTTEPLIPATLTHAFVIQQYETTQKDWKALGFRNPTGDVPSPDFVNCKLDSCAVGSLTYFEALAYANAKSERDGYASCYELIGCNGKVGEGMTCNSFRVKDANSYECTGYRFPMGAEWEYAARAGTRTPRYASVALVHPNDGNCFPDPYIDEIAWWCNNYEKATHPVGLKKPNNWGLYDILGNSAEYVIDHRRFRGYGTLPVTDPGNPVYIDELRVARGGLPFAWGAALRAACWAGNLGWNDRSDGFTIRLVRTLNPRPAVDAGGVDAASDAR
jgi:formylglycine-generating enzyme